MKKTTRQLIYQIQRNFEAAEKLENIYGPTSKQVIKKKELVANEKKLMDEIIEQVGMYHVPIERSEEVRTRLKELGVPEEDAVGVAWWFGDGWA